jgi:Yip1 domain
MTPETSTPEVQPLSEPSRIANVYLDPKKAFADIAARPRWIVPIVLMALAALIFIYCFSTHVGWETYFRKIAETNTRMQQMPPEQRETALQMQIKFGPIFGYIFGVLAVPVSALVVAGVMLLIIKMMGGSLRYKQMFAISVYSMLPALIFTALAIIVMYLKAPEDFNLQNPLFFNIGAAMEPPPNSGKFIYSLATSIDLFTFWQMALMAVGISVAIRKWSFSKALTAVVTPWIIWVLAKSAWAAMFG